MVVSIPATAHEGADSRVPGGEMLKTFFKLFKRNGLFDDRIESRCLEHFLLAKVHVVRENDGFECFSFYCKEGFQNVWSVMSLSQVVVAEKDIEAVL